LVKFVDGRRPRIGVRSLAVDGQGRLARKADSTRLEFTFEYRGFLFAVRTESNDHSARMRFHAHLGNLPYSAESLGKRADALAIAVAAGRALGGRVQTTREQWILLFEEMLFEEPLTPVVLMSGTVRLLLEAQPFLELLTQVVEPPVAAGHANVQEV
jgi:hypothetical protein